MNNDEMMMTGRNFIQIDILNECALDAMTAGLSAIDRDRAVRSGLARGGGVLARGGRQRLRQRMESPRGRTGNLLRSFTVRVKRRKPGVLVGFAGGRGGGQHAHLVDLGTVRRRHPLTGTSGTMPANRFWSDTRSGDMGRAQEAIRDGLVRFVERVKRGGGE